MKKVNITHRNLNNGEKTKLYYPLSDKEFKDQFSEIFENEHYREGRIKKGAVYVDLGANIGLTALYFAPYAKEYYAVEPSKECCRAFKKNTKDLKGVKLFNYAIFPREIDEYLFQVAEESVPQTLFASGDKAYGREKVKCIPIDKFFKEAGIEHVDVLKIDVESSEFAIFPDKSFGRVADKIDFIVGETHYNQLTGAIPEFTPLILKEWGFKTRFTDSVNLVYKFHYTDEAGDIKTYEYQRSTMFIAERRK